MGLFNYKVLCEKCGNTMKKDSVCLYDSTRQGVQKNGEKMKLCNKCGIETFLKQIKESKEKAIFIYPSKEYNAYCFYKFDELIRNATKGLYRKDDEQFITDMQAFLTTELSECSYCQAPAIFTLCTLDIFKNKDPFSWEVESVKNFKYVCKECLINELLRKIRVDNISFNGIFTGIEGEGFYTPWDV